LASQIINSTEGLSDLSNAKNVEVQLARLAELSRAEGVDLTKLDAQTLSTIQNQLDSEQAPNEAIS